MAEIKKIGILFALVFTGFMAQAQNPRFDKLEMLFDQGHYKRVYRLSNRLLDNPTYDFSQLPNYYKSLSLFQMCQNEHWFKRHPEALDDAMKLFVIVRNSPNSEQLFNAHMYELSWLKNDMISWAADQKRIGKKKNFEKAQEVIDVLFEGVDHIDTRPNEEIASVDTIANTTNLGVRDEIVLTAKNQLGVPYVWAGNSPDGFDCSGFTSYVMSKNGSQLPRRAADQYSGAKKVKAKHAQKGDLVFFDNGSGISHVGIIVSEQGESLTMIHSSSSRGVIVTNIPQSTYWSKRLKGFATYVQ